MIFQCVATELLFHHALPFAQHGGPAARYFLLLGSRSMHSAPQNLVCLSIKHGVQRLVHQAKNHRPRYKDV
jgi:hypothetical protein